MIVKRFEPVLSVTVIDELLESLFFYYSFIVTTFGHLKEKNTFKLEVKTASRKLEKSKLLNVTFTRSIDFLIVSYQYKYFCTIPIKRRD